MLSVENLSIAFRRYAGIAQRHRLVCLRGVTLTVGRGEVLAVVGASGAGKSLLAYAILGLLPPNAETTGQIVFDGVRLTQTSHAKARGRRMSLVPQSIACLDPLVRVGRQIEWAASRAGLSIGGAREAGREALARYGLDAAVGSAFPHELSGGMARRVLLATATVAAADLIVADEPTSGLDPENAKVVLRYLRSWADAGHSVLIVSHDLRSVPSVADRVAILHEGRTVDVVQADAFSGDGSSLSPGYPQALWQTLPENRFDRALQAGAA